MAITAGPEASAAGSSLFRTKGFLEECCNTFAFAVEFVLEEEGEVDAVDIVVGRDVGML